MPSEKILEQKKQQVAQLAEDFKKANVGVLVNYEGITVEKDTKLRKQLREAGCEYKVVKNTLLSLAFQEAGIEGLEEHLHGATAIAYSENGYVDAPKILSDYAKDNENFTVKAGFIDGDTVDAKSIDELAKLPPKEVLVAQVLGGLNGPIQGFATCSTAPSVVWLSPSTPLPRSRAPKALRGDFPHFISLPITKFYGGILSCLRRSLT